jgi:hypothetical protein
MVNLFHQVGNNFTLIWYIFSPNMIKCHIFSLAVPARENMWHFIMDLIQYRIGTVPLDACRNHDHKIDKYRFFRQFLHFSFMIIHKSVWKDELDLLKFMPLGKNAWFYHFIIQAPCPVYTGIRYLVWCSNSFSSLTLLSCFVKIYSIFHSNEQMSS